MASQPFARRIRTLGVIAWHVCAVILPALPRGVAAEPPSPPKLVWHAEADCPDLEQVRRTINDWLTRSVEPVDASSLSVRAEASRDPEGWSALVTLESPSGRAEHRLAASSCETLVEVLALKVALAASSLAKGPGTGPPPSAPPPPPPPTAAASVRALALPAPRAPLLLALRVGGAGIVGRFPHVSSAFQLAGALVIDWVRLELAAWYAPVQSVRYRDPAEVGADLQVLSGGLRACGIDRIVSLELLGCLGAELGVMGGTGVGTAMTGTWHLPFAEVVGGLALRYPFGPLALWFELGASIGVQRPSYSVRYLGPLYRPGWVGGRAFLGLELQI
jgi:hypothetical protein